MSEERSKLELGAKMYEIILHIFGLIALFLFADTFGALELLGLSLIGPLSIWPLWLIFLGLVTIRLYILHKLKVGARSKGLLLTEFVEQIKENKKLK